MCQVRQRNGMKPPKTWVLDIKYVVRNQKDVLEHRNGVKIPKMWVLDLKECIEIFQVVWLESYCSETFNQMHADTSFRNGSGTSMKWPETRVLDVKYVVRNQVNVLEHRNGVKITKTWVLDLNECIEIFQVVSLESYYSEMFNQMHPDTSFRNGSGALTKWRETPQNKSFGPKVVEWACSLL